MRLTIAWGLLAIAATWAPYGLIHQGQRRINPKAQPVALQMALQMVSPQAQQQDGCDPTTPDWRGCK